MKFEIPKTTRFLALQEYDPENASLAGVGIHVWVDPPRQVLQEFDSLNHNFRQLLDRLIKTGKGKQKPLSGAERLAGWLKAVTSREKDSRFKDETESYRRSIQAWYTRLWSQNPDAETHWTVAELEKINDQNPRLYEWLCVSSWALIEKHREDVKKGFRGPSGKSPVQARPATPS